MSDIEKVKKLRSATGAGFKDCNLAIKESNGDLDKACIQGKKNWISRHNLNAKDVIITPDKHVHAKSNHILIDDMDRYIEPWSKAGGIPIKHTDTNLTIRKLEDLLKN